jgi:hypothetical protein
MKHMFLWLVPLVAVVTPLAWATVAHAQRGPSPDDRLAMYEGLRAQALATKPGDLGIEPSAELLVYGVVMDMDIGGNTATIVSFSTGDTSLYYSTGGGTIGAGGQETVATASRASSPRRGTMCPAWPRPPTFRGRWAARPTSMC